jgi:mono/diheme cytochrome c family protein
MLVLGGALSLGAIPAAADDAEEGEALAERLCANCHLNPGQGEKSGPSGVPGFRAVARRPGQSLGSIVAWLKTAPPMMPNHHLTQDEMFRLAAFILSLEDMP